MPDKTVEKEYEGQLVTGNKDNGTQHCQKGNSCSSTSHKSSKHSKGSGSAGGSTGGSKDGHSN